MCETGDIETQLADAGRELAPVGAALQRRRLLSALFGQEVQAPRIGRYRVLETLGDGGMGIVYAAHDPELDRPVALKLLHGVHDSATLLDEARALARLTHPNVVPVYDVGVSEERVFLAMEWVRGSTLRAWLATPRSVGEVVEIMVAAGRGLSAVHAAGIVHRDFKPDNVLVGDDGRVRVTDFGLARGDGQRSGPAIAGTVAYMAPEQARSEPIDERADVHAFAVTLDEVLDAAIDNADGTKAFDLDALRRVSRRGRAEQPAARWPSMDAVLAALERASRRRFDRVRFTAVVLAIGVPLAWAWPTPGPTSPTRDPVQDRSDDGEAELAGARRLLDEGRYPDARDALRLAYESAVQRSAAKPAARAAIELVFVTGHLLADAEAGELWARHAEAQLSRMDETRALSAELARNRGIVAQSQGRVEDARDHFAAALALRLAEHGPVHPSVGHAYENLATLAFERGDYESSRESYEIALTTLASTLGPRDPAVAMVLDDLGNAIEELGDRERATRLYRAASALRETLPAAHPHRAVSWANLGTAARREGRLDDAERFHREALAIRRRALGSMHPNVGISLADLAEVLEERGDIDEAIELLSRARVILEHSHGPEHRRTARVLGQLAELQAERGQIATALPLAMRASEVLSHSLPPSHPHRRHAAARVEALREAELSRERSDP